jgi:hypothetical protein
MDVNTEDSMSLSDDSGWSSSDDSDIEELLQDDDVEMMGLLLEVQKFEDRAKLLDQRRGSKMGRVSIYRNRALGHEQLMQLMQDYFALSGTSNSNNYCYLQKLCCNNLNDYYVLESTIWCCNNN